MKWAIMLAGIAGAAAYYMYKGLSEEEKKEMVNNLKDKGKKAYDKYVPDTIKDKVAAQ